MDNSQIQQAMSQPFDLFHQPPMPVAIQKRDASMASVQANAGETFGRLAREFVVKYLSTHGATPGEDITDACVAAGIKPHDDRAFGPIYMSLSKKGIIKKVGMVQRRKGNATAGGWVWELNSNTNG